MDEDDVFIAVHEIHHRLGGVAEKKKGETSVGGHRDSGLATPQTL